MKKDYTAFFIPRRIDPLFVVSKIATVFYFEFSPTYRSRTESHDFWEFIYVDKGSVVARVEGRDYALSQGEYTFHKPNDSHMIRSANGTIPSVFIITFVCHSPAMRVFDDCTASCPYRCSSTSPTSSARGARPSSCAGTFPATANFAREQMSRPGASSWC